MTADAPFIELSGDPYELGRQHGAARAAGLRAYLDDGTARLNHLLDTPVSLDSLAPVLKAFRSEIEAGVPDLAKEIRGLADGAGLGHDEALLLQVRREILGYRGTRRPGGDCTTYARVAAGGHTTLAQDLLERFRMTVAAAALGFARRASDTALAHTRNRRAYGGTLFDLQLVKASLADMEVRLNASALLTARAAWECDRGGRGFARHSNIAKVYATEAAQETVDAAVQLFGAAGVVRDGVPERLYRQIRSLRIYEGSTDVLRLAIADSLDVRRAARAAGRLAKEAS